MGGNQEVDTVKLSPTMKFVLLDNEAHWWALERYNGSRWVPIGVYNDEAAELLYEEFV